MASSGQCLSDHDNDRHYRRDTGLLATTGVYSSIIAVVVPAMLPVPVTVVIATIGMRLVTMMARDVLALIPTILHNVDRHPFDDHRLPVDDSRWRIATDVHATIDGGLADAQRYAHIGSKSRSGGSGQQYSSE